MIDIHSHILPGMDDGSRSIEEGLQMLEVSARQGIRAMVATPHFYATENSPAQFLSRRAKAAEMLQGALAPGLPRVLLGAEVCYFGGISHTDELEPLKVEGTELLLLEMPFSPWSSRMIKEVVELQNRSGTQVLLAHIERYLSFVGSSVWAELRKEGVWMQCNASFFLNWKTKRRALRMLRKGEIHAVGSDCHNMLARPPRLGEAVQVIQKAFGERAWQEFDRRAAGILKAEGCP